MALCEKKTAPADPPDNNVTPIGMLFVGSMKYKLVASQEGLTMQCGEGPIKTIPWKLITDIYNGLTIPVTIRSRPQAHGL